MNPTNVLGIVLLCVTETLSKLTGKILKIQDTKTLIPSKKFHKRAFLLLFDRKKQRSVLPWHNSFLAHSQLINSETEQRQERRQSTRVMKDAFNASQSQANSKRLNTKGFFGLS